MPRPPRYQPRPNPAADVLEELGAQATAAQIMTENRIVEQRKAAAVGATPAQWLKLDPAFRAKIEALAGPSLGEIEAEGAISTNRPYVVDKELFEEIRQRGEAALTAAQLHDHDEESFVYLWDKPIGGMHWQQSRIHISQMRYAIVQKGFSPEPYAPIAADPDVPCPYRSPMGVACGKMLRSDEEVTAHQQAKHRVWWEQEDRRRARERDDLMLAALRTLAGQHQSAAAPEKE